MRDRTAIFVLGMHRSGTSALTRVLSLLGAALPRNVYPPGPGNETGHWEPEAAVELNDRILSTARTSVNDLYGPTETWFQTEVAARFVEEMKQLVTTEFLDERLFVFKDPRTSLLFPLWRRALAQLNVRCVTTIISRNPVEVALSLADRQTKAMPGQMWPLERGGLLWLRYTLAAERYTRGSIRSFCLYSDLLKDWRKVANQLARELDVSWPRPLTQAEGDITHFLSAELRHQCEPDDVGNRPGIWSSWVAPVYAALCRTKDGREPDRLVFDAVGRSFEEACMGVRSSSPAEDFNSHASVPADTQAGDLPRARKSLCLVGSAFCMPDEGASDLNVILDAAAAAGFSVTIVQAPSEAVGIVPEAFKEHHVDIRYCAASVPTIEPAFLRPSVELFRNLRSCRFDVVLFQDREALGFASVVAKHAGLAFEETLLGVVAFGSSRWRREGNGEFPTNPTPIATEYVEQKAIELSDIVLLPSQEIARWMEEAGWQIRQAFSFPEAMNTPSSKADGWLGALQKMRYPEHRLIVRSDEGSSANDVTIVIPHFEQPGLLDETLTALTTQTEMNFSVLVVDDGSQSAAAAQYLATIEDKYKILNLRLLRQENLYLGAARNAGIRAAMTDFIILLDHDNIPFPDMVKTLRRAILTTGASVVTCGIRHFHDSPEGRQFDSEHCGPDQFFSGGPVLLGAIHNCFGDASGIYRKAVFDEIGYFHELHGTAFEDWQMHLRVVTAGFRLLSLPEPLVWYRVRPNSMLRTTRRYDNARVIASTVRRLPCSMLEPLADYLMGSEIELGRLYGEVARLMANQRG
ncbi:glycosyltransferase [uncultured Bradyrhizobium sp.]|uniref:glycosyltransferase n=1 Tax=uncultured Bradyrhizobium sp. TaxID=199684 RepID=UPI0035C9981B